jgi:hypothetical protein
MNSTLANLCIYAAVLAKSADETTRAEDRTVYTQRLAAVARMFVAAHHGSRAELEKLIASERHAFGWGYLSGVVGAAAERAFDEFAKTIESKHET